MSKNPYFGIGNGGKPILALLIMVLLLMPVKTAIAGPSAKSDLDAGKPKLDFPLDRMWQHQKPFPSYRHTGPLKLKPFYGFFHNLFHFGRPARIYWSPKSLELEVPLGGTSQQQVSFVPNRDTGPLRLEVFPRFADYLDIEPQEIEPVQAGESVQLTVTGSFDTDLRGSWRAGVIHVREGLWTLATPLNVKLFATEEECGIVGSVHQGNASMEGVSINLDGTESATAKTDHNGEFSFLGLEEGEYTVWPQKIGYSFEPQEQAIDLTECPTKKEVDFTAGETTASIDADPQTIREGETSTLNWTSSNADNCSIEPDIGKVELSGSFDVSPSESTTYTISATGPGDGATDEASVEVTEDPEPEISIISPSHGDTVFNRSEVMLRGTIDGVSGKDVGISVNCSAMAEAMPEDAETQIPANIYGNEFAANNIPLAPGENTITVKVTDLESNQIGEKSVDVYYEPEGYTIKVKSNRENGVAPLEATLEISGSFNIDDSSLSYTGPGQVGIDGRAADEYGLKMSEPGIYYFTVEVEDPDNNILRDKYAFAVMSEEELDQLLRSRWNDMKSALADRDIDGALNYFSEEQRQLYRDIYSELSDELPQIVNDMQEIEMVSVSDNLAKYRILKDEQYGGENITVSYKLYFVKSPQGLWKIHRY